MHICSTAREDAPQTPTDMAGLSVLPKQSSSGYCALGTFIVTNFAELDPLSVLCRIPFLHPKPSVTLISDMLALEWGAQLGPLWTRRVFGPWWSSPLIPTSESWGQFSLPVKLSNLTPGGETGLFLQTTNTAAMFYFNRQEGTCLSFLCQEAIQLWEFFIAHSVNLKVCYLPGMQNKLTLPEQVFFPVNTSALFIWM